METPRQDNGSLAEQVEEILELARDTNKQIKAMRRDALIGGIVQFVFWAVIVLGSLYFTVKFLEPYMAAFMQNAEGMQGQDFGALFEEYRSLLEQ